MGNMEDCDTSVEVQSKTQILAIVSVLITTALGYTIHSKWLYTFSYLREHLLFSSSCWGPALARL